MSLLCAVAIGATGTDGAYQMHRLGFLSDLTATQRNIVQSFGLPDSTGSDRTRLRQVHAWYHLSGYVLINLTGEYRNQLATALQGPRTPTPGRPWTGASGRPVSAGGMSPSSRRSGSAYPTGAFRPTGTH
ncbi:hypothetical protein NKH18_18790 [Streptomyces sp. M10(2022)]